MANYYNCKNVCDICGEYIGMHFDHSECWELRKEMHKGKKRHAAVKRISKKKCDNHYYFMRDNGYL